MSIDIFNSKMKDSERTNTINHTGIVQKSDNESVTVIISSESACAGCHAKGICSLSGKEEKLVVVKGNYNVCEGETVTVVMKQSTGFTALFLGYLLPLILVVTSLGIMVTLRYPELLSGVLSIASLIPYYLILFFFRKKINDKFVFSIKV
ncbi:MAG TPA: Fis family transcriptional regulator [Bacteroidales bacterium]|nr:Fis family transcriptional regulator [Bacteroidales bacterium]HBH85264.1 Fis family transcriptional regulator [Bacteroidales bacterium]HBQ83863.1 Fis family transcriptional regulator [Bacteroidales bacterium]